MNPQSHRKLALSLGSLESLIITFPSKHHVLKFSQETGTRRDTYMYREIYSEGLASMVQEAEKSHRPPSASWRPRTAGDVVPASVRRPGDQVCWCPRVEDGCPSSSRDSKFALSPPFCSVCTSLEDAHPYW